eukprot:COSAG06_NODE_1429_length_9481_cov_30.750986_9_plen_90_part_00
MPIKTNMSRQGQIAHQRPPPGRAIPIRPQPPLTAAAAAARAAEGEKVWEDLNEPEPVTKQSFVDVSFVFSSSRWAAVFLRARARRQQHT